MVLSIVFIQPTNYLSLSFDSSNRSPNLLKTEHLQQISMEDTGTNSSPTPLLLPHPLPLPHGQVAVQMKLKEQVTEGEDSSLSWGLGQIIAEMSLSAQLQLPDQTP